MFLYCLQENMLVLQSLPSLPKLEVLQKKKREELEKKRRERMLLAEKERAEQKRIMELNRLQQEQEASAEKYSVFTPFKLIKICIYI